MYLICLTWKTQENKESLYDILDVIRNTLNVECYIGSCAKAATGSLSFRCLIKLGKSVRSIDTKKMVFEGVEPSLIDCHG